MNQLLGLAGVAAIILIAVVFSSNRKAIRLRIVGAAFALQAVIAFLVIRTSGGRAVIQGMSDGVASLLSYATKGTEFLFGPTDANPLAHTFAIAALPVIVFFASLVAILYHLGIMQKIVKWVGGAIGWVTSSFRRVAIPTRTCSTGCANSARRPAAHSCTRSTGITAPLECPSSRKTCVRARRAASFRHCSIPMRPFGFSRPPDDASRCRR